VCGVRGDASDELNAGSTELTIWVSSLSLLLGNVAIAFCACRSIRLQSGSARRRSFRVVQLFRSGGYPDAGRRERMDKDRQLASLTWTVASARYVFVHRHQRRRWVRVTRTVAHSTHQRTTFIAPVMNAWNWQM